jgi:hypothetical protein
MKTSKFICIVFIFLFLVNSITGCGGGADSPTSGNASAGQANLAWNASTSANVAGYKLYYGTSSGNYTNNIKVGMVTSYTVSGLAPRTYYFAVTAYDASGNESGYSNEVSAAIKN